MPGRDFGTRCGFARRAVREACAGLRDAQIYAPSADMSTSSTGEVPASPFAIIRRPNRQFKNFFPLLP